MFNRRLLRPYTTAVTSVGPFSVDYLVIAGGGSGNSGGGGGGAGGYRTSYSGKIQGTPFLHYNPSDSSSYSGTGTVITDLSGNNDGDLLGGIESSYDQNHFDIAGNGDGITTSSPVSVNPSTDGMTIEMWFKVKTDVQNYIFSFDGTNTTNFGLSYRSNTNKISWFYKTSGGTVETLETSTVSLNQWHHIVATTDGSNAQIYLDGSLSNSTTSSPANISYNEDLHFGNYFDLAQNSNADIGEIRFYKEGLVDKEVFYNYEVSKNNYGYSYYPSGRLSSAETAFTLETGVSYTATVGAGGDAVFTGTADTATLNSQGNKGGNSTFYNITSIGGGCGAYYPLTSSYLAKNDGGSGGGAVFGGSGGHSAGSTSGTTNQGFGGNGGGLTNANYWSGGGGGAGAAGDNNPSGNGGAGLYSNITGSVVGRGGGGSQGPWQGGTRTPNNFGGGGGGSNVDATDNTGGGGGGGGSTTQSGSNLRQSGDGGDGVIILRYPNTVTASTTGTLVSTQTTVGSDNVLEITSGSGDVSFAAGSGSNGGVTLEANQIMWLDANNANSWTGTGSTWYDLSDNNYDAEITTSVTSTGTVNGATFLNLTTRADYFKIPYSVHGGALNATSGNVVTYIIWMRLPNIPAGVNGLNVILKTAAANTTNNQQYLRYYDPSIEGFNSIYYDQNISADVNPGYIAQVNNNDWMMVVVTNDYSNNTMQFHRYQPNSTTYNNSNLGSVSPINTGNSDVYLFSEPGSVYGGYGEVGEIRAYDTTFTVSELDTKYNDQKSKYGIT